jgi:hypothetical protein
MPSLRNKVRKVIDFSSGINAWNKESSEGISVTRSHPYNLRETEEGYVDDILNLLFDDDGSLIGRFGIKPVAMAAGHYPNTATDEDVYCMVHHQSTDLLFGVENNTNPTTVDHKIYDTESFTTKVTHQFGFTLNKLFAGKYGGFWYIYSGLAGAGLGVNQILRIPATGSPTKTTYTMRTPDSEALIVGMSTPPVVWKDRFWSTNIDFLFWSKATDPTVWLVPDGGFIRLPGEHITDLAVLNETMYVLTRSGDIYALTYTNDPSTDGYFRKIIDRSAIRSGSTDSEAGIGNFAVCDNRLYVCSASGVYQIVNNQPYSIADALQLDLNRIHAATIHNLGFGLLYRCSFNDASSQNEDMFVYHISNGAWTRIKFPYGADDADSAKYALKDAWLDQDQQGSRLIMFQDKASIPLTAQGSNAYMPVYQWDLRKVWYPPSESNVVDKIITTWNGNGGSEYRQIKHRISTGIKYLGLKDVYKRFWNFTFDAFLGWRQAGTAPNNTPYKTTVEFVPAASIADLVDSTMQRTPETTLHETVYVVPINQRARGISLIWETEDTVTWATEQDVNTAGENVDTRPVINEIAVIYSPINRKRYLKSSTAGSDASTR